jgi:hypothetical protein
MCQGFETRKKSFLLLIGLLLLRFGFLEVVGVATLLFLLQEGYHCHGLFLILERLLKVLLQCLVPIIFV